MHPYLPRIRPYLILSFLALFFALRANSESNILLWDTVVPISSEADLSKKTDWRVVPDDLFKLEKDPLKSSSDPGYYGREYAFKGDMVVENRNLTAAFFSATGQIVLYSKTLKESPSGQSRIGEKVAELVPLRLLKATIRKLNLLRNSGDEVVADVFFGSDGSGELPVRFNFGKSEIIEIKPHEALHGLTVRSPIEYGVIPSFVGDDLIFGTAQEVESNSLSMPAENLLLALLKGERHELVFTWLKGQQRVALNLGEANGKTSIISIDLQSDGNSFFVAPLCAPGVWHREDVSTSYLEKEITSKWKRPFPARWQTELLEAGVRTRFAFRNAAGTVWRGVPGSYNYPVWFEGEAAHYQLSKKVPPKGESVIYFVEGQETPPDILTPVDILKGTLGRSAAEDILDVAGRKLRTHHRRGGEGVRRACTCGCTEAIQSIFEAGEETTRKTEIADAIADMIFFVQMHVQRIEEYRQFSGDLIKFLQSRAQSSPELKPYIEKILPIAEQIPQEYDVQRENMKSLAYADELSKRTMGLAERKDAGNVAAYMELLKGWRGMGGAQDYVVAQCHTLTRKLFQEASYEAAAEAKALNLAFEVRSRCRQILRNADGYEIWPNY